MYTVQINNFAPRGDVIPGWSVASSHTKEEDANTQMALFIETGISADNIKIVAS